MASPMLIYSRAPITAPQTEDELLSTFFGTHIGTFVDVGAHDGRSYSNTRPLWERGWSGTLIEPDPDTFKLLLANYPDKSRLTFHNIAIAPQPGKATFTRHSDPNRTGWHSMDPRWIASWEPGTASTIVVPTARLDSLVPNDFDFLSIDTEGMDAVILASMPMEMRPRAIMCEVDKHLVREAVESEMERRHYRFIWGTYLNSFYERIGSA